MIYIYHFNKLPSIEKDGTVVDEITYKIGERCYRRPHCELLGTEAKYPEGQAIQRYVYAYYSCM